MTRMIAAYAPFLWMATVRPPLRSARPAAAPGAMRHSIRLPGRSPSPFRTTPPCHPPATVLPAPMRLRRPPIPSFSPGWVSPFWCPTGCVTRHAPGGWGCASTRRGWKWCCRSAHDCRRPTLHGPFANTKPGSLPSWPSGSSVPKRGMPAGPAIPMVARFRCWARHSRCAPSPTRNTAAARYARWAPNSGSAAPQPATMHS